MQFVPEPATWPPAPESLDDVAAEFGAGVFSLVPQRHLEHAGVNVERSDGVITAIAVHYSAFVNPDDREDPVNFHSASSLGASSLGVNALGVTVGDRRHDGEVAQAAQVLGLPDWVRERMLRSRYPMLWEAVRTSTAADARAWGSLAATLAQHLDHVARNASDYVQNVPHLPDPESTDPNVAQDFVLEVDGDTLEGIVIAHRGYRAYAAELGDRVLSAVIPDNLPIVLDLRFVSTS